MKEAIQVVYNAIPGSVGVVETIERVVHYCKGWRWARYKGKRYQVYGGVHVNQYIRRDHPITRGDK